MYFGYTMEYILGIPRLFFRRASAYTGWISFCPHRTGNMDSCEDILGKTKDENFFTIKYGNHKTRNL
ncbi:MAG: hypothetical protein A3A32_02695 [Candidatus Wildermuthbacteria bacterium RIFCSPLOWO2_01_FULL_48_35]|uniref:Uncharacterized protein n=1 Tax=Candidatus Wildermuthbacteria bacterium RIFCSPLOWO2_01_FULL_48_35 TaxID=1802463 RepID=A0A1G2RSZ1_9BACT|nr:MAG: hypothetical protein A3A32_02695 [Candidatus Wildermuthbacteria bacterium RIFCSPLOWO2_01_FULL_48_35]